MANENAGNNSKLLLNEAVGIINKLLNDQIINTEEYKALYNQILLYEIQLYTEW